MYTQGLTINDKNLGYAKLLMSKNTTVGQSRRDKKERERKSKGRKWRSREGSYEETREENKNGKKREI